VGAVGGGGAGGGALIKGEWWRGSERLACGSKALPNTHIYLKQGSRLSAAQRQQPQRAVQQASSHRLTGSGSSPRPLRCRQCEERYPELAGLISPLQKEAMAAFNAIANREDMKLSLQLQVSATSAVTGGWGLARAWSNQDGSRNRAYDPDLLLPVS